MPDEFSKPLAPADDYEIVHHDSSEKQPLTNADFRRLLETPRVPGSRADNRTDRSLQNIALKSDSAHSFTHRAQSIRHADDRRSGSNKKNQSSENPKKAPKTKEEEEEDELNEIMKKYRDRAKERRQGEIQENQKEIDLIQASGYKAVAPDLKINLDLAEKRKKVIEESKYLGGDMEHTHLVKGLDYALLQKVRSEIVTKEREEDDLEQVYLDRKNEREEIESHLKTPLARNMYNVLFKSDPAALVNELFAPRRMAYVIDMDDDLAGDTEVPVTLIRSKQDCPVDETNANLSINDMVIQKLTQVLSYLRADNKKKKKGKEKVINSEDKTHLANQNIFDEDPSLRTSNILKQDPIKKPHSYFEKPPTSANSEVHQPVSGDSKVGKSKSQVDSRDPASDDSIKRSQPKNSAKKTTQPPAFDSYAECYPGGMECYDAAGDSDDDADFSKMDLGNKKGPIRRWDFETPEEYEEYMSGREALPKAAFQYGVKMLDGRKTRKVPGAGRNERDDKAKIDRQWAKISQILAKRTEDGDEDAVDSAKKPKF